jgi:hypothetical protein
MSVLEKGCFARVMVDTVYDVNGIPVSITPGRKCLIHRVYQNGWCDILVNYDGAPELFGIDLAKLGNYEDKDGHQK